MLGMRPATISADYVPRLAQARERITGLQKKYLRKGDCYHLIGVGFAEANSNDSEGQLRCGRCPDDESDHYPCGSRDQPATKENRNMSKRKIPPFKMIPVELREHLHELTGNETKVWLILYLHSDKTREAFPSNALLVQETGLTLRSVKTVKASLRKKGWITSTQRKRDNGSLSTMSEKIASPKCKTYTYTSARSSPTLGAKSPPTRSKYT
jgi:hypothetical protein